MSVEAPVIVRFYEPLNLVFPKDTATMPPRLATVKATPCLLCETHSHLPPSKMVWVSAAGAETMGLICGECYEHEAAVAAKFNGNPPATALAAN